MKKLVPLKSIYSFIAVAETGSMTNAANALCVSHSAVSQAIKSLEQQVGKPLFQRVGRNVILNADGKRYYKKVSPALETIVEATEELTRTPEQHRLTLNMINSLAMHWWIPRVQGFQQFAPKMDIRISTLAGTFQLEKQGVDVALVHGQPNDWQDYYCEKLSGDELIMVCSPQLIPDGQELSAVELLNKFPAIAVTNERRKHDWSVWCEHHNVGVPTGQNNLSFNVSIQAVQAAIRQLGIFITHRQFVRDDINHGLLKEIGDAVTNPYQDFYFVCPPDKLKLESVLQLRNWLRKEFNTPYKSLRTE
ncbi:LysR family transcriptional regulator [Vibrio sp. T187]|uniref:LysR substrate-binding domain-containing protein n=1 Tax=Vibrio TaxID=662 RepID=UPI0010C984C2|nr:MULTISPECIES: LysR substrate-binding domain-containing protein [Vibrio]MBW3695641.1 LysR family transcriptional regulator [Vibrio sp. T187]